MLEKTLEQHSPLKCFRRLRLFCPKMGFNQRNLYCFFFTWFRDHTTNSNLIFQETRIWRGNGADNWFLIQASYMLCEVFVVIISQVCNYFFWDVNLFPDLFFSFLSLFLAFQSYIISPLLICFSQFVRWLIYKLYRDVLRT